MNITQFWNVGISYERYMQDIDALLATDKDNEHYEHYDINYKRMDRIARTFKADESLVEQLNGLDDSKRLLVITEGWCGDASQIVPVVQRFFGIQHEVKYIYRDEYPELMNQFLTNGSQSIPIVLILDEGNNVLAHWGPRPQFLSEYLVRYKADPVAYPKEQFINDLQLAYNRDKGVQIVKEIMEKMK